MTEHIKTLLLSIALSVAVSLGGCSSTTPPEAETRSEDADEVSAPAPAESMERVYEKSVEQEEKEELKKKKSGDDDMERLD